MKNRVFTAFKHYLGSYLNFVDRAEPVTSGAKLDNIIPAQLRYLRYRSEKDPTRGMFN